MLSFKPMTMTTMACFPCDMKGWEARVVFPPCAARPLDAFHVSQDCRSRCVIWQMGSDLFRAFGRWDGLFFVVRCSSRFLFAMVDLFDCRLQIFDDHRSEVDGRMGPILPLPGMCDPFCSMDDGLRWTDTRLILVSNGHRTVFRCDVVRSLSFLVSRFLYGVSVLGYSTSPCCCLRVCDFYVHS